MSQASSPKQGDALYPSLGVSRSWWVQYPRVFIFADLPNQPVMKIRLPTGEECFGFSVERLAEAFTKAGSLRQSPSDIVTNNEIGSLKVSEEEGILTPGAFVAIDFVFSGAFGAEVRIPFKAGPIRGNA